jgi:hypothetical protein
MMVPASLPKPLPIAVVHGGRILKSVYSLAAANKGTAILLLSCYMEVSQAHAVYTVASYLAAIWRT